MSLSADVTAKSHNPAAGSGSSSVSSLSSAISSLASTLLNIRNKSPVRPAKDEDEAKRLKTGENLKRTIRLEGPTNQRSKIDCRCVACIRDEFDFG